MENPNHYHYVALMIFSSGTSLRAYYDYSVAMHRGQEATYQALVTTFTEKTCPNSSKLDSQMPWPPPVQNRWSTPWSHASLPLWTSISLIRNYFIGELPVSPDRNKWILKIACPYSNFPRVKPVPDKWATTAASYVFVEYGFPSVIRSGQAA